MSTDKLTISRCPICENKHIYELSVRKSTIHFGRPVEQGKPITKKFTRFFVCPKKDVEFQASFTLKESLPSQISDVEISKVLKEE